MRKEFEAAFDAWISSSAGRIKRESSREIYRAIWGSFARDLPPGVAVLDITSEMVADYLATGASKLGSGEDPGGHGQLSIRYQARVASLIEKIMGHHAEATGAEIEGDTAVRALMRKNPALANALKRETREEPDLDHLDETEHAQVKSFLIKSGEADLAGEVAFKWSDVRDRTSMALQLGAGLSPSDVRELTLKEGSRNRSGFLFVPKNGKLFQRHTLVDAWAAELLQHWINLHRDRGAVAGVDFVFPGESLLKEGTRQKGQWSKAGQHKQTTKVLASLGVGGSSFKLRHTWALAKLREGTTEQEVATWLGVKFGGEVMLRYREVLNLERGKE